MIVEAPGPVPGHGTMPGNLRHLLARLTDGLPEARYQATLALLRGCLALAAGVSLLLLQDRAGNLVLPAVVNLALGVASLLLAIRLGRLRTPHEAWAWGRWSTAGDLALYTAYSVAFHDRLGAGTLLALFVLLEGPLRYGLRGLLVTVLPVAVIASVWPQPDSAGAVIPVVETLVLCLVFALPTIAVRAVVMRGSARVRQAERQFATAFEHASIGMALVDLQLRVLLANRALGTLVGEPPQLLHGTQLDATLDRLDRERAGAALRGLTPEAPSTRLEVRLRRPDGGLRWGHLSASLLTGATGVAPRIVVQVENITERKRSEAMLSHAAAHDALTDLPNRTLLLARLDAAMRSGEDVAVLFLDLDRFKVVNDGLGHAAGDLLLVQVAIRLREVMRPDDMVARLGGDEFVVLCRGGDVAVAESVAARVLGILDKPLATADGTQIVIGGSIGIALAGPDDTAESVLRDADTAMYAAKAAGGSRAHVFTPQLREAVVRAHELEVDLRAAVRSGGLSVVYQPIISLPHGKIPSCEALARWSHPQRGAVPPQDFIAVAEQSDLVIELGDWVLARALQDAAAWPASAGMPPPVVAVNVSLRQLLDPRFPSRVADLLRDGTVDASRLCLEVTETVLGGDVDPVIKALEALRRVGVRLAIDDFGTGHASLTYLARFPVDEVKIDQSFVAGLGLDAGSGAIVGGVIGMAHTFDLRVVAEGVETEGQLSALEALGCDEVQGYLLGRPMSQQDMVLLLLSSAEQGRVPLPRQGAVDAVAAGSSYDEARRTHLLVEGAKQVTGRLGLDSVLEQAFRVLADAVAFTGGSILLVDGDEIRIAAGVPSPTPEALAARIPLGQGVSGAIAVSGEPRYLPDITIASTVTAGRRQQNSSNGVRSWYGVPLIAEGRPIGVLQLDSTEVDAFDETDRMAVLSFAPVVALAVISVRQSAAELRKLQG
jgi:diguanylate cyclase (GGDEF)-like protein/PAS domain S-box-containing protein